MLFLVLRIRINGKVLSQTKLIAKANEVLLKTLNRHFATTEKATQTQIHVVQALILLFNLFE